MRPGSDFFDHPAKKLADSIGTVQSLMKGREQQQAMTDFAKSAVTGDVTPESMFQLLATINNNPKEFVAALPDAQRYMLQQEVQKASKDLYKLAQENDYELDKETLFNFMASKKYSPAAMGLASKGVMEVMKGMQPDLTVLGEGQRLVDPVTGEEKVSALPKPLEQPTAIEEYEYARQQGYKGTFEDWKQSDKDGTSVNVNLPGQEQETNYDKAMGTSLANLFIDTQAQAKGAQKRLYKVQTLAEVLQGINTGKYGKAFLEGKKILRAAGFDLESLGITDDIGAQEAGQALANEMALEMRNPEGGAGMPGAMSEKDREFLVSIIPGLTTTPEGRKLLVEIQKKVAQRSTEEAKLLRQYAKDRNGRLDLGVYDALDELRNKDLFDEEFLSRVNQIVGSTPSVAPGIGEVPPPPGFNMIGGQ